VHDCGLRHMALSGVNGKAPKKKIVELHNSHQILTELSYQDHDNFFTAATLDSFGRTRESPIPSESP
jgi:hypothetical protein